MNAFTKLSAMIALAALVLCAARPASADLPAARLLNGIANVANGLSERDARLGKAAEARVWNDWSAFFRRHAAECPQDLQASQLSAMNAAGLPRLAQAAEQGGQRPYARLCRASGRMWADMLEQIRRGGEVIVRFPDEFLAVIPGAPHTPWQGLRPATPPIAPAVSAGRQQDANAEAAARLLALLNARQARPASPASPGAGAQDLIRRLNGMSLAEVNALTSRGHWLDQFTPAWVRNAPGGNVLAQFGIGNGLIGALGTTDPNRIFNQRELDAVAGRLRQAQALGQLSGGMAAQNRVANDVRKHENLVAADQDRQEALRRLYEAISRTGVTP
jgi:hypothetical protein